MRRDQPVGHVIGVARRIADAFAPTARMLGMGQEFDIPFPSQRYGTVPDSAWKLTKYHTKWTVADSINASLGQGYFLANPLQLAVMAARLGSGRMGMPRMIISQHPGAKPDQIGKASCGGRGGP